MVESGLRDMPTPALVKLAFFEQASLIPIENKQQVNAINLVKHLALCTKKMMLLEKKQNTMKNNYSRGIRLLQAVSKCLNDLPTKDSKQDKLWLSSKEKLANKIINDNSLAAQKLLNIQIKVIQYEIKLAMDNK